MVGRPEWVGSTLLKRRLLSHTTPIPQHESRVDILLVTVEACICARLLFMDQLGLVPPEIFSHARRERRSNAVDTHSSVCSRLRVVLSPFLGGLCG